MGLGRPIESERVLRRAIALRQDDATEGAVAPAMLVSYARTLLELGRLGEAADYAERGSAKAQETGDQAVIQGTLLTRAAIYRKQGDLERAAKMLSEVEPMVRRSSPAGDPSFTTQQAALAQAQGDLQKALDLTTQAVAILESRIKQGRTGSTYSLPSYLGSRSEIELKLGHKDEAAEDAARALKILLETTQPGTFSTAFGRTYLTLGRALQAQGKREEASGAFRSAFEHLQSALGSDHTETRDAHRLAEL